MQSVQMTFDDFLTLNALQFKSTVSGQSNSAMLVHILKENPDAFGMKNMCFRVHPVTQARLEATLDALGISKQEALTVMLNEMLDRFDQKLRDVGLGSISYDTRLKELGYELGEPDADGRRSINPVTNQVKE